jgi:hypothetical protein
MTRAARRGLTVFLIGVPLTMCAAAMARDHRGRASANGRLAELEAAMSAELPARASPADVIHFLDAHGVSYPKADARQLLENDCASGVHGVIGDWRGPLFDRALFLWFEFDKSCRLVAHRSQEVEGS